MIKFFRNIVFLVGATPSYAGLWGDLVKGAVGGVVCVVATPFVLGAVGFGAAGVAAGSLAASLQTAATVSGSAFSVAQSVGAAGLAGSTMAGMVGTGTVLNASWGSRERSDE